MHKTKSIKYSKGFKYQLKQDHRCFVDIRPEEDIFTEFIELYKSGLLVIKNGYAWDGPSGPTIDTLTFMHGSLIHDSLYQIIRMQKLPRSFRKQADLELVKICKEDGMWAFRRWWVYWGVRLFAKSAIHPNNRKRVIIAP